MALKLKNPITEIKWKIFAMRNFSEVLSQNYELEKKNDELQEKICELQEKILELEAENFQLEDSLDWATKMLK